MGKKTSAVFIAGCIMILIACRFIAFAADNKDDMPHNQDYDISCASCHVTSYDFSYPPEDACKICHDQTSGPYSSSHAPYVKTHSSANTSNQYGNWEKKCYDCHEPHRQAQKIYDTNYLASGTIVTTGDYDSVSNTTPLTYSLGSYRSGWDDLTKLADKTAKGGNDKRGATMIPDTTSSETAKYTYFIKEVNTGSNTITVMGNAKTQNPTNTPFKVVYGQLIRDQIYDATNGVFRTVKFFDRTGTNSFADGDSTYDGVCEVCHTKPRHFRNDGNAPDQLHTTTGFGEVAGTACTRCHAHANGFAHGDGSIGGGCVRCHGHDAGTYFDPDMSLPYTPGPDQSQGRGTHQSHSTHTESVRDPDTKQFSISPSSALDDGDRRGPGIYCSTCHNTSKFPRFRSKADPNAELTLSQTDICDTCHSPGGTYDGVNDPVIGAKANWHDGIYAADGSLKAGKEKWCAGCHDKVPGNSKPDGSGINAPNVIGDEDGSFTYGTGWGFYKTGHGLPSTETYPSSGGLSAGANRACGNCHDLTISHIDHEPRTYNDNNSTSDSSDAYRQGYRLKLINGLEPMTIPKTGGADTSNFRLCASCHTDTSAFTDPDSTHTNFRDSTNRHYYHLSVMGWRFSADWDFGAYTSRITCITCHNVHGSTRLAMIRDGKLVSREPGIQIWYYNSDISTNTNPPFPEDLPLSASKGMIWIPGSAGNVCYPCHGGPSTEIFGPRIPFQPSAQAPRLDWTGENGYVSDGATLDSGPSGSSFTFRVKYSDNNNDEPDSSTGVQLWIDADNNGSFESTYTMTGINEGDNTYINPTYVNGKIYTKTLTLTNAGGNIINYRFYTKDSTGRDATGPATGVSSVTLTSIPLNNPPTLSWVSGSCRYQGVSPATGVSPVNFDFRVQYTDADNNAPTTKQVWVDLNDDGDYDDANEKQDMILVGGDGDYRNGEIFTKSLTLNYAGDGKISYRFVFSDGIEAASGDPASDRKVTIIDSAATRKTVCASGCDYTTIQAAVDAINGAHTVIVYTGTYNERVYFNGANDNDTIVHSVCGPDDTIISASGVTPAYGVEVYGSTGSVVDGFGIVNSSIGVYLHHSSASTNLTLENCKVHDNTGSGGIYTGDYSSITVNNSEIYSNTAATGAGLYLKAGTSSINDTIIRNNHATANGGGVGTGLWNNTTFTNTTIKENVADGSGGGFAQTSDSSTVAFYRSTILGNVATTGYGGGLYIQGQGGSYGLSLQNTVVADNTAPTGGGIYLDGIMSAVNCTIANNTATGSNGGGALYADAGCDVVIRNSILWNNSASIGSRHIAYLSSTAPTTISDSILNNDGNTIFNRYPYFVVGSGGSLPTIEGFVSGADPFFVDAYNVDVSKRNYHILSTSPAIDHASATYAPADDIDGDLRPQGMADDIGADEYRSSTSNSAPVLSWTGETNYTTDGVDPDSGNGGTSFTFRVDYADANNDPPASVQVWIDKNDDGAYSLDEKYDLTAVDGDTVYSDGKRYARTLNIGYNGDGVINYRFYASDGEGDATGAPTSNKSVTLSNTVPTLGWTGEANYTTDGVHPDSALGGSSFEFRVDYTDADNVAPAAIQVWVDRNDDGDYDDYGEKIDMTEADAGDTDYSNGKRYTRTLTLFHSGDGNIKYRFYAKDSATEATGEPASDKTVTVANTGNTKPVLSWTGETNYTADGVDPDEAVDGSLFTFRVKYSDADNVAPSAIQVWVDLNDSGTYEDSEKFSMTNAGGSDYAHGVIFTKYLNLSHTGDGHFKYRFYADDGMALATGEPGSADKTVWVYHLREVPSAYGTIQAAIDASVNGDLILVAAGTYQENINFRNSATYEPRNVVVRSVGGSGVTSIVGVTGSNAAVVTFQDDDLTSAELDGFTIDNQAAADTATRGIQITGGSAATIRNCVIKGNNTTTSWVPGSGIYIRSSKATIENCTVGGDAANKNTCQNGCGIYAETLTGPLTIKDSTISQNAGTSGSGIYLYQNGDVQTTITNTTISNNTSVQHGGGMYANNSKVLITGSTVSNNSCTNAGQHGGGLYISISDSNVASAVIENTNFSSNTTTQYGGAIYAGSSGSVPSTPLSITGGSFTSNSAGQSGGAVYLNVNSVNKSTISKATFAGNSTVQYGGGFYLNSGNTTEMTNCIISGNTAGTSGTYWEDGGGIYNLGNLTLTNCTVAGNYANDMGGGLYNSGTATVLNSIFWDNVAYHSPAEIYGTVGVTYSDIKGGYSGTGNINLDPLFVLSDPASKNTPKTTGNYHIQAGSNAIDKGTATNAPADDYDGNARPQAAGIDMGADEYLSPNVTATGTASATAAGVTSIDVSMPYTGDSNANNTYTVDYRLSSDSTWTNWVTGAGHAASPYATTITGLTAGATYDVRMTYNDADGVNGTNPQTVTNITLPVNATTALAATATMASTTSIVVDMPYTGDGNADNTYTVDYKLSTEPAVWTNWVTGAGHVASPYTTTITGLTAGAAYDVRMTYNDGDGVNGTNPQTVSNISLTYNSTSTGSATAVAAGDNSIAVSMPYANDNNANNTYTVDYKLSSDSTWINWVTGAGHVASPYTTTITGLTAGAAYDVRMTYNDGDGVNGTNPQTVSNITLPVNSTTVGAATAAAASSTSITVSMPYTDDNNANNTYTVDYKLSTEPTVWTNWVTGAGHVASPYTTTIAGLTAGATYDVRMTYNDGDGVNGTNPQTVSSITLPVNSTSVGSATATAAGDHSIAVSMPYTGDSNANNTYTVDYKLSTEPTVWTNWVTGAAHVASPYTTTITGLTSGATYDVRMTYNDSDGVNGTNPQTVSNITLTHNSTTVGSATATAAGDYSIAVSMPYTGDNNANNTYTVKYKLNSSGTWLDWGTNPKAHTSSPYTDTITGLTSGATYDVQLTYNDDDGVNGTNPQTVTAITLTHNSTTVGTATATASGVTSIAVSMPYTGDNNANNTYTVDYKLSTEPTVWTNWVTGAAHVATPYTTTITGLTAGASYDVRMTYNDANGVNGANPQTVSVTLISGISVCSTNPAPFNKIQTTIADAGTTNGSTLLVCAGTYPEKVNFLGKNITVRSVSGSAVTFITGDNTNNPVVTFSTGETSAAVLDGFTIDNQAASSATRGVYINGSAPTIKNSVIQGNSATNCTEDSNVCGGGGVYIKNSAPTFDTCTIRNNVATNRNGGGIYITGAAGGATITNSTIGGTSTSDANSANFGGGIYITGSTTGTLSISGSTTIAYNTTTQRGAGIYITGVTNTTAFANTSVSNNTSSQIAGGIYGDSPLLFTNCNINNNATGSTASYDGGGIYLSGASASAIISGGTINGNSGRYGGGIYITGSTAATPLSISGATMSSNTGYLGGAVYLTGVTNTVSITGTAISGNTGQASGGGIYNNAVSLDIANSHIDSNVVANASQKGGGLYLTGAKTTTITNTTVNSNTTDGIGGGMYVGGGATLQFTGSSINSNTSSSLSGGGIALDGASVLTISKANIRGNKAYQYGGGIYFASSSTTASSITNSTITGNTHTNTSSIDGGGIYTNGGTMNIINGTIAGNYAYRYGGGIRVQAGTVNIKNSIIYGNTAGTSGPQISGAPTVTYSDVEGGYSGTGNIDSDPSFVSFTAGDKAANNAPKTSGDFHIQSGSPCKNTGNNADAPADTDIDGDTRILNSTVDIGSDEYSGTSQTVTLHPSGLAAEGSGNFAPTGGTWADVLDVYDSGAYVSVCCQGFGTFYVDMDNTGIGGSPTINAVTIKVVVKNSAADNVNIGYKTGTSTIWKGDTSVGTGYQTLTLVAPTNSDGGAWTLADLDNLRVAVLRDYIGPTYCYVTEVAVEINYTP